MILFSHILDLGIIVIYPVFSLLSCVIFVSIIHVAQIFWQFGALSELALISQRFKGTENI